MDGRAVVRYFVKDISLLVYDFPVVTDQVLFLVVSSKKLSDQSVDASKNIMKVYSACIVNLPIPRGDDFTVSVVQTVDNLAKIMAATNLLTFVILALMLVFLFKVYRQLQMLQSKASTRQYFSA